MGAENLTFFGDQGRRILRLYHLYRLTIGLALVLLISSDLHNDLLQMSNPQLFQYGAWLYLILNIIVAVLVQSPKRDLPVLRSDSTLLRRSGYLPRNPAMRSGLI